jgi:hypothetical protein
VGAYEDGTECSKTLAIKFHTPENPKENIQVSVLPHTKMVQYIKQPFFNFWVSFNYSNKIAYYRECPDGRYPKRKIYISESLHYTDCFAPLQLKIFKFIVSLLPT